MSVELHLASAIGFTAACFSLMHRAYRDEERLAARLLVAALAAFFAWAAADNLLNVLEGFGVEPLP